MANIVEPTERQVERLAIVRYQISIGQEQVAQPAPLYNLALNTIQDFVESSLHIIAESHKAKVKGNSFDMLLESVLAQISDDELSGYTVVIKAMNKARVNFKHHGNTSSSREVSSHLTESIEFVRELARKAYDKDLDDISITSFIKNEKVRRYLDSAEMNHSKSDSRAMVDIRIAFDELIKDYKRRKLRFPGQTIFDTKPSFLPSGRELEYLGIEKIIEWVDNLENWVQYMALGISMRHYAYFDAHTPKVQYSMDGKPFTNLVRNLDYDKQIYNKCRRFVIDTALAFAQDDYDFDAWNNRRIN